MKKSIWCFLSFPFSNAGYLQLMYGENIECFMEGMIDIFAHLGGVPSEIWFDKHINPCHEDPEKTEAAS